MTRSELQDYGADEPVWRFIAQLERERFTGQADVGVDARVELYVAEGRVYFAQKSDDPPLGARLVSTGVITTEQFRNGSVKVGDSVSLARLFQRVPAIDRDAVELMTERLGRQVLEAVSERPVGPVVLHPLRHHPSGIHQWFPDAPPAPEGDEPSPAMAALVNDVVAAVSGAVPMVIAEPVIAEPVAAEPVAADRRRSGTHLRPGTGDDVRTARHHPDGRDRPAHAQLAAGAHTAAHARRGGHPHADAHHGRRAPAGRDGHPGPPHPGHRGNLVPARRGRDGQRASR